MNSWPARAPGYFERVLRASPDFTAGYDPDGVPLFANDAALRLLGVSGEDLPGAGLERICLPGEWDFVRNVVLPIVREEGQWRGELTFRKAVTGVEIPVHCDFFRVDDPGSPVPVSIAVTVRDLTAEKQRAAELHQAHQRMESVLAATEVATWIYEIGPDRVLADANLVKLFGLSPAEAAHAGLEPYLRAVHAEDRARVTETIKAAIQSGAKFLAEYRIAQSSGEIRSVIARGTVERDRHGQAVRLPGVILDITDRVRAEGELARQSRVVKAMLSSISDFTYIFDRAGRFVFVNKPLLDLWGLELEEAAGKNFFDLHYPDELAGKLQRQIQQVFETGEPLSDKTPYTSPTGAGGFYEYIFSPVRAADGSVELVAGTTRDISRDQQTLEALRRSEENFRTLAETLPDMVWTADAEGRILWTNSVMLRESGLSLEQIQEGGYRQLMHPGDLAAGLAVWEKAQATGEAVELQHRVRQADGGWRWHLVRGAPAHDAGGALYRWIGTATDIHEQLELNRRLERSEALFRQLADTIPNLAWMTRPDGAIFWYNSRWYEYTGTTPEQMEGWGWQAVHDPVLLPEVVRRWRRSIETGEPFEMTFPIRGADGIFRPFLTGVMPFRDETGKIVLWFGTNTDVSEQKRILLERDELLISERAARSTAEHASRMKDEFLATLSHELRSPLNAIFGWTQILREDGGQDPESLAEGLEVIDRNVRIQTQLIEDLLDMSRIISGKLRLDVQQLDPGKCVEAAMETVVPAADAKSIRIEKILDPRAGLISGDPGRIQQIIWNLLSNAIKFTPRGGKVRVVLQRVNSHLEISVADSGQGIGPEFLPHVFDRFRQADAAMNRKHGGLGLGLAIVKQLVELHGGTIRAGSGGEGKGTTFTVHLPLKVVHAPEEPHERHHPRTGNPRPLSRRSADLSGLKVLVVDDEKDARELLKRVLEDCGAAVTAAGSATEALALIQIRALDAVVSDIGMPGVDGYEFMRRVRALPPETGGRIPAVALTAFARSEDRTRALQAGFLAHVAKPVEPSELIATIAAVTGRGGMAAENGPDGRSGPDGPAA
ncbi:MAG: PAS domain S-box protein [Verrucomicrobiota bacterium]